LSGRAATSAFANPPELPSSENAMRLKAIPADFVVEEKIQLPLAANGRYAVYRVRKQHITTLDVQEKLSALLHMGKAQITFPALKDKEAIATQYVSVAMPAGVSRLPVMDPQDAYAIEPVGMAIRALQPADLRGNAFAVVVRDLSLSEAQRTAPRMSQLAEFGLPNYFDEQRFGSYTSASGFIGKAILRRDAAEAVRIYLSVRMVGDPERVRVFKEFAAEHWGDWSALMEHAPRPSNFRSVLTYLKDHPDELGFRKALNLIPHHLLTLYLAAYQAWLWNLIAARYIGQLLDERKFAMPTLRVAAQDLPAYYNLPENLRIQFQRLSIPLPNHRALFADPDLERIATQVLAKDALTLNDFKARILKKAFATKSSRLMIVKPTDVQVTPPEPDELARKRWKVALRFTLPPGSYATMAIKALFAHEEVAEAPAA
jgi:tRNA pseudouridine13 synthase